MPGTEGKRKSKKDAKFGFGLDSISEFISPFTRSPHKPNYYRQRKTDSFPFRQSKTCCRFSFIPAKEVYLLIPFHSKERPTPSFSLSYFPTFFTSFFLSFFLSFSYSLFLSFYSLSFLLSFSLSFFNSFFLLI